MTEKNNTLPAGFTETGFSVYRRTYQRDDETWEGTVHRVVDGNLSLVDPRFIEDGEREQLIEMMISHKIVPGGRHLFMSGVPGRQFLFNCHLSGWTNNLEDHFTFTFLRLMEGGGVGANYSRKYIENYRVENIVKVHLTCHAGHPDYAELDEYLDKGLPFGARSWPLQDSREGWSFALGATIRAGTHIFPCSYVDRDPNGDVVHLVFDLSNIRPKGAPIKTFGGTAAGPVPLAKLLKKTEELMNTMWLDGVNAFYLMKLDHAISECVVSGNVRRSARMSIMRWDDPEIDWFLRCKENPGDHWSTNISVEIDDEFITLVNWDIMNAHEDMTRVMKAQHVYRMICDGMLKNGEPGFWNSSLANIGETERVVGTNPCGEISLAPFENCNLGHVNLAKFVKDGSIDGIELRKAHRIMARFLIRATYGDITDDRQRNIVNKNRRIGVGHLGYQWFVNLYGEKYSSSYTNPTIRFSLVMCREEVEYEAARYARKLRIPTPIKTTTVAPTGTISKMSGVSSGIQPIIAKYFILRIRFSSVDPDQIRQVEEYRAKGYNVVDDIYSPNTVVVEIPSKDPLLDQPGIDESIVESQDEINIVDMLGVQRMYQELYADNGVSFTINLPEGHGITPETLQDILRPHLWALKGTTVMVDGTRPLSPYERITREDFLEYSEFLDHYTDSFGDGGCTTAACPVR